jgi:hypothetical protein
MASAPIIASTIGLSIPRETVLITLDAGIALTLLCTLTFCAGIIAASAFGLPRRLRQFRRGLQGRMHHPTHPARA